MAAGEGRKPASEPTTARNAALAAQLPLDDRADLEDAKRGLVAPPERDPITAEDGRVVWEVGSYDFLAADCPPTANPSLWRQSRLNTIRGLFEIAPGFYQLRGFDLSNMHVVEGGEGMIVIDPLISVEAAASALELYRAHRGERPVTAVVYTHSHIDHFGGVKGVVEPSDVSSGRVPVVAPEGFLEHAVAENVFAGTAMARRAHYMYGATLGRGPDGQLGAGLGMTTSTGTVSLLAPTLDVTATGQEETLDGVRLVFQLTPGTEAPAEMNFHFPDHRVLCIAENATHTLHNTLTLRGALVRDPHVWARYLNQAIELFGRDSDALFAGHHWPRWGSEAIVDFLAKQRDLYGYLHDQTLRLLNRGLTGAEIAEQLELPPSLEREWHCRGYYGSVSHNVKAVYQRYMGWFDGNPAHLWEHPPVVRAGRYVEAVGGADAALEKARAAYAQGDYRWVAELANHVVFADPENRAARELQADALEQLGYGAENATWRNFFLTGADELRSGETGTATVTVSPDMVAALSVEQIVDGIAVRVDGPRAWDRRISIDLVLTDTAESRALTLENGVLNHVAGEREDADATLRLERATLDELVLGSADQATLLASGRIGIEGDAAKLVELFSLLDEPDAAFAIVTP